jgi:hypothetical protein
VEASHKESNPGRAAESRTTMATRSSGSTSSSRHGRSTQRRRPATADQRTGRSSRLPAARSDASVSDDADSERSRSNQTRYPRGARKR